MVDYSRLAPKNATARSRKCSFSASQRGVTLPALAFFIRCSRANACSVASFGKWWMAPAWRFARLAPPAHRRGLRNPGTRRTPGKSRLVHASTRVILPFAVSWLLCSFLSARDDYIGVRIGPALVGRCRESCVLPQPPIVQLRLASEPQIEDLFPCGNEIERRGPLLGVRRQVRRPRKPALNHRAHHKPRIRQPNQQLLAPLLHPSELADKSRHVVDDLLGRLRFFDPGVAQCGVAKIPLARLRALGQQPGRRQLGAGRLWGKAGPEEHILRSGWRIEGHDHDRRLREPLFGDPEQLREPGSPAAPATLDALPSRQIGDRLLVLLQPPGHFRDPEALIRDRRPQVGTIDRDHRIALLASSLTSSHGAHLRECPPWLSFLAPYL